MIKKQRNGDNSKQVHKHGDGYSMINMRMMQGQKHLFVLLGNTHLVWWQYHIQQMMPITEDNKDKTNAKSDDER